MQIIDKYNDYYKLFMNGDVVVYEYYYKNFSRHVLIIYEHTEVESQFNECYKVVKNFCIYSVIKWNVLLKREECVIVFASTEQEEQIVSKELLFLVFANRKLILYYS